MKSNQPKIYPNGSSNAVYIADEPFDMNDLLIKPMTNQPKTEDGNEWLNIWVNIHFTENSIPGIRSGELTDESKKAILSYIQSNYILKSDVEDFIKISFIKSSKIFY